MKLKNILPIGAVAAAAVLATSIGVHAQTATTTPVGYKTETLAGSTFNVLGVGLHEPTLVAGTFETVSGTTSTDDDVDFSSIVTGSDLYILEITSGAGNGIIQEIVAAGVSGNDITTVDDLEAAGVVAGDTYRIRRASTVNSIFGEDNSAGLTGTATGNIAEADVIFVPNSGGGFTQVFYLSATDEWLTSGFAPAGELPIIFTDSLLVQRKAATEVELTVTGEVRGGQTILSLSSGFNYVGSSYPVGSTLGNLGLEASLDATATGNIAEADVVLIQNSSGGFDQYFYLSATGEWLSSSFQNADNVEVPTGFVINRKTTATDATINAGF